MSGNGNGDSERRIVNDLIQTQSITVEPVTAKQLFRVLRRRWWLASLTALIVSAAGIYHVNKQPAVYEATAQILVATTHNTPVTTEDLGRISDLMTLARERSAQSQAQLISSPAIIHSALQKLTDEQLQRGYRGISDVIIKKALPEWAIAVDSGKTSDIISVTAKAYDPQVAADVANTLVQTYMEHDAGLLGETAERGRRYIESEMKSVQRQLDAAQRELASYKRQTGLVVPDSQLSSLASNVASLQTDLDRTRVDLVSADRKTASLRRQLLNQGAQIEETRTAQSNPQYQALLAQLDNLITQSVTVNQEYAPESKQVTRLQASIADTKKRLQQVAQTIVSSSTRSRNPLVMAYSTSLADSDSLAARARALENMVAEAGRQMESIPDDQRVLSQLSQKVQTLESTYQALANKYYAMVFNERSTLPNSLFAATARAPLAPSYPNRRKSSAAFILLGIFAGLAVAAVAEQLDSKVSDIDQLAKTTGSRILARVPKVKIAHPSLLSGNIDDESSFAESFRLLRNSLYFRLDEHAPKIIAVTSPGRGDGKGTVCLNLAAAAAMCDISVLVIDCDFRNPSLHQRIRAHRNIGLTDLVAQHEQLEDAVISTETPNVYLLPSGSAPSNPSEYLFSQPCYRKMRELSLLYDLIILDCPPTAGLSDMQGISRVVDGVLMVVSLGKTSKISVSNAVKTLQETDANALGVVINRVNARADIYDHYRYHRRRSNRRRSETDTDSLTSLRSRSTSRFN